MGTLIPTWLSLQWPSQCLVCRRWPAQAICIDCHQRLSRPVHRCRTCALPLPDLPLHAASANSPAVVTLPAALGLLADKPDAASRPHATPAPTLCGACLRQPPPLASCWAAVDYGYPWSQLIAHWKFQQQPALTRPLAQWMQRTPGWAQAAVHCDCTIAMPLASARLRERGYNQALLLARALRAPHLLPHALQRVHHTDAQAQQTRAARLRNVHGAFAVPPPHLRAIAGQRVLLIDDVMTTGATLHAAAQCLLQAGAHSVHGAVFARTLPAPHT